jgi:HSP20 family protein
MMTTRSAIPALDRVFDEALRTAHRARTPASAFPVYADVREKGDGYTFQIDVPGVTREGLEITLAGHVLSIRGERRFEGGENEKVTCGRPYGAFAVSFAVPDGIDGDTLTADLADGVLTVRIPKEPKAQPRKIAIGSAPDRRGLGS